MMQSKKDDIGAILALDTATSVIAGAILQLNTLLAEEQMVAERSHSVYAVSRIEQMLQTAGISGNELQAIAVGVGPGSYTGVRVAVAAGKTLAYSWNKPLIAVSTLAALAWGGWSKGQQNILNDRVSDIAAAETKQSLHWVIPIMDARRGQAYTALYEAKAGEEQAGVVSSAPSYVEQLTSMQWQAIQPDAVLLLERWLEVLQAQAEQTLAETTIPLHIWFVGELDVHLAALQQFQEKVAPLPLVIHLEPYLLEGRYIAELGGWQLLRGEAVSESAAVHAVNPNYAQLTEAEVNLQKKQ